MKTLRMYGASDDLIEASGVAGAIEASGVAGADEFGAWCSGEIAATFVLGGRMRIHALYTKVGCWGFAISQVDEDVQLPDWPIRISQYNDGIRPSGYSTLLEIDVPDDATLIKEGSNDT